MKKTIVLIMIMMLAAISFMGCGDSSLESSKTDSRQASQNASIKGEVVETDNFSMIVATGYNQMNIDGGIQAYQGKNAIEVWVRGTNVKPEAAEKDTARMAEMYKGTEVEKSEIFGMPFQSTRFEVNGVPQTLYIGVKDGKKIQIGITGTDHENNEQLQGMFHSINLK